MIDDSELRDLDPFSLFDAEARRLDGFFVSLHEADWARPTRCEGWRRRELLAHLAASEDYNHATLDGTVPQLIEQATAAGAEGLDAFNAWGVQRLAGSTVDEVLALWRSANGETRQRFRALGWDGTLQTFVGPYPAGLQAFHLAHELALHADDMAVPVADGERRLRGTWQARFARFTLREYGREVEVETDGSRNRIRGAGHEVELDDEGLVDACSARLPADHPMPQSLRNLLRVFA
jgi:uncharacterized protein (TIGR03083 family)